MRRFPVALLALLASLLLAACASSNPDEPPAEAGPPLGVTIRQIHGSSQLYRNPGRVALQYIVTITNPTDDAFHIDRVEVRSPVPGAYAIRSDAGIGVNRDIPPKMGLNVPYNTWGTASGGRLRMEEPVTVAVIVYATGWDKKAVVKRVTRTIADFDERPGE